LKRSGIIGLYKVEADDPGAVYARRKMTDEWRRYGPPPSGKGHGLTVPNYVADGPPPARLRRASIIWLLTRGGSVPIDCEPCRKNGRLADLRPENLKPPWRRVSRHDPPNVPFDSEKIGERYTVTEDGSYLVIKSTDTVVASDRVVDPEYGLVPTSDLLAVALWHRDHGEDTTQPDRVRRAHPGRCGNPLQFSEVSKWFRLTDEGLERRTPRNMTWRPVSLPEDRAEWRRCRVLIPRPLAETIPKYRFRPGDVPKVVQVSAGRIFNCLYNRADLD